MAEVTKPHLSIVICGHVDSGKSTTTGRLLFELGGIPEREMEKLKQEAAALGKLNLTPNVPSSFYSSFSLFISFIANTLPCSSYIHSLQENRLSLLRSTWTDKRKKEQEESPSHAPPKNSSPIDGTTPSSMLQVTEISSRT